MHSAIVKDLYQRILGRTADPIGLAAKVVALESNQMTIAQIAAEMIASDEFIANFKQAHIAQDSQNSLLNSVTQYDELYQFLGLALRAHIEEPFVVDCGARGRDRSNSYDLMRFYNWKGLLIEANPRLIPGIEAEFSGLDYKIVSCAVADKAGKATLTIGVNDDVSSLDRGAAAAWGETKGEVAVEMRRLPDILDDHRIPKNFGLLSLDIEGFDIQVMNDLINNSDYRPQYVIIEASFSFRTKSLKDVELSTYVRASYDLVGQTEANLILRRSSSS